MRTKTAIRSDSKGYYYRNLGWVPNRSGTKLVQPKFLLGKEINQAQERLGRLLRFWRLVESHHQDEFPGERPAWDDVTLDIAKAICRGEHTYPLARRNEPGEAGEDREWSDADYAGYLLEMQRAYPVITLVPADSAAFQNGVRKNAQIAESYQDLSEQFARDAGKLASRESQETLHQAIRAYIESIDSNPSYKNHEDRPGTQPLTAWAYKVKFVCQDFMNRYDDRSLSTLTTLESVQSLYDYWRSRPKAARSGAPITIKTVKHRLTVLSLFLRWLHKTDRFSWRKPVDFEEIERSVSASKQEIAARATPHQADTFSDDELLVLYRNTTTPLERILMLLGLNCGFKQAEVGTLQFNEVFRHQQHPFCTLLELESGPQDSYIKRIRQKTSVYAEFKLWPDTVNGIEWLISRRRKQVRLIGGDRSGTDNALEATSVLLTNKNGYPMYRLFRSGNPSQDIAKSWKRVVERAASDDSRISRHTYSALRRTTADFIRRNYDGEVTSLFLSHGHPFERDKLLEDYTNRPYRRLFEALDAFGERLSFVFKQAENPFPPTIVRGGANISPRMIAEIKRLLSEGMKKSDVANAVGVHRATVHRYSVRQS